MTVADLVLMVLLGVDVGFSLLLVVVACRLQPTSSAVGTFDFLISALSSCTSLAFGIWVSTDQRYSLACFFAMLALDDLVLGYYASAARDRDLRPGFGFLVRLVFANIAGLVAVRVLSPSSLLAGGLLLGVMMRLFASLYFFLDSRSRWQDAERVDELGVLRTSTGGLRSAPYIVVNDEEADPNLSASLLALAPSFVETEDDDRAALLPPIISRRSTSSNSSSSASFSSSFRNNMSSWGADDAGGVPRSMATSERNLPLPPPPPPQPSATASSLPSRVEIIGWKEIHTSGGVPLVVFVIFYHGTKLVVHRYGEFRALSNRFVLRVFAELGLEPPGFPVRRTFRKLLPEVVGGWSRGEAADREFYTSRAMHLQAWLNSVLEVFEVHSRTSHYPSALVVALQDFLRPIEEIAPGSPPSLNHHQPDDDRVQAGIARAIEKFARVLNDGGVLPSP